MESKKGASKESRKEKKIKDTEINDKEKRKQGSMEVPLRKKELGCPRSIPGSPLLG